MEFLNISLYMNINIDINTNNSFGNFKSIYLNGNNLVQSNKIQWDIIALNQVIAIQIYRLQIVTILFGIYI